MSAWETVPTAAVDDLDDDELEEWLVDIFDELAGYQSQARFHNQDGYFARVAGSTQCLALGHKPDEQGEWEEDDEHESGWNGDLLCRGTEYGTCCTECEGECSFEVTPLVWELPGVRNVTEGP